LRDAQRCGTCDRGTRNLYDPTACGDYGSEKLECKRTGRTDLYKPERERNVAHDTGFGNRAGIGCELAPGGQEYVWHWPKPRGRFRVDYLQEYAIVYVFQQ